MFGYVFIYISVASSNCKRAACGCHIYTLSKDLHHFSFLGNSSVSHLPWTAMSIKCAELFVTWVSRVCVCMYINT